MELEGHAKTDDEATPAPPPAAGQGRTLLIGGGLALVVLFAVIALLALGGDDQAPVLVDGQPTPQGAGFGLSDAVAVLPGATLGGFGTNEDVEVADLLGDEPLVLNFWATWCAPCVAEMPELQELHEAGEGRFRMVGINTRDAAVIAESFVADLGITYDLLVDADESYFRATGSFGMPTTLFVRPDGSVAYRFTGPLTLQQMADLLEEHLAVSVDVARGG
ncbi:hypothetical protein BH23ACT9_BH23ACT9_21540 [soil metagenome]